MAGKERACRGVLLGAAFGLLGVAGLAHAGSITQPGATIGAPAGAQAPEGVYFNNNLNAGNDRGNEHDTLFVEIPAIIWATPYHFVDGQLILAAAAPSVGLGESSPPLVLGNWQDALFNPEVVATLAWKLGGGFFFSQSAGLYAPSTGFGTDAWVPEGRSALTYLENGWNVTANVIYGFPQGTLGVSTPLGLGGFGVRANDYLNVDFTAVKTINKWSFGLVAFGSTDLETTLANIGTGEQSQIAVGGLIGYDFGPVSLNFYFTHDVYIKNYGVDDTRVWSSLTIPLWVAPKEESLKDTRAPLAGSLKDAPVILPPTWAGGFIGINAGYAWAENGESEFNGPFVGAQAGWNYQSGPFVLGVETDIQGGGNAINGREIVRGDGSGFIDSFVRVNDWGTVHAKLGYGWGPVLLFATGGFAWGDVNLGGPGFTPNGLQASFTPTGWTAGGGLEYRIAPNWSVKAEYQFIDLGHETVSQCFTCETFTQDFNFNTFKLGLNWYIGAPEEHLPLK